MVEKTTFKHTYRAKTSVQSTETEYNIVFSSSTIGAIDFRDDILLLLLRVTLQLEFIAIAPWE
jgi:hypothetical protein